MSSGDRRESPAPAGKRTVAAGCWQHGAHGLTAPARVRPVRPAAGRAFSFLEKAAPSIRRCCLCVGRRSLPVINSSARHSPPAWRYDAGGGHGVQSKGAPSPSVRRQKKRAHQGHVPGMQRPCRREKETREWDRIAHEGGRGRMFPAARRAGQGHAAGIEEKKEEAALSGRPPHRSVMKGAFLPCRAYGGSGV